MWSDCTSCLTSCKAVAGLPPSSIAVILTGWPLIPPAALTLSAQATLISFKPAKEAACTPEQLQIAPTLKLAPVTLAALRAPVVECELERGLEPHALSAEVSATATTIARTLLLMCTTSLSFSLDQCQRP